MPKERAERAIKKMVELSKKKGGKISKRKIMIEAGFSEKYADQPSKFFKTKTAQQLREKYLPVEKIYKLHEDLLDACYLSHYIFPTKKGRKLSDKEIKDIIEGMPGCKLTYIKRDEDYIGDVAYFTAPDNMSRDKALDKAYKIYGNYAPEKVEITDPNAKSLADIDNDIKEAEKELNIGAKKAKK